MTGKVLTKEDIESGVSPHDKDTSPELIPSEQKLDQDGNVIEEEPEKEETLPKKEGDEEPLPKPSDEFKPKHKTWEETEKARVESERKMHEATTKASTLERELTTYKKPPEPKVPSIDDKIAEIADDAIKQIGALPIEYDSEGKPTSVSMTKRDRDAAIVWAKAQRTISRLEIDASRKEVEGERSIVSKTYKRAQDEGLKTDAELRILGYEFSRTDPNLSVDDRINEAITNTKGMLGQVREGFVQSQEKDKKDKDALRVLGRGSSRTGEKEEKGSGKPTTMSDQLVKVKESRRVKKDDLF